MREFTLVWRNALRQKLRSALLVITIAIAFLIFGVLAGFERILAPADDLSTSAELIVGNRVSLLNGMPSSYADRVAHVPGVAAMVPVVLFPAFIGERANAVAAMMVEPESYFDFYRDSVRISAQDRAALLATRDGLIIDQATAASLGWRRGDRIQLSSLIAPGRSGRIWPFTIAGIFEDSGAGQGGVTAIGRLDYYQSNLINRRDLVHWLMIRTERPELNDRVAQAIDAGFANSAHETRTQPASSMASTLLAQLADLGLIVRLVVGASFVTILFIVGNTFALTIRARTREIGVMRTLGFRPASILRIVLLESILIAFTGGLIGLALASSILKGLAEATRVGGTVAGLPLPTLFQGLGLMMLLGLLTGLLPAWRAMRLTPAAASTRP
jgi:putative ABC transport system permease protein